mmetsp:Transcript_85488/g.246772  ORF Transcript_85488/g.246772 Transcript_85488/m.246772 type:complete len:239 (-) Transcript_85488:161-877(-)
MDTDDGALGQALRLREPPNRIDSFREKPVNRLLKVRLRPAGPHAQRLRVGEAGGTGRLDFLEEFDDVQPCQTLPTLHVLLLRLLLHLLHQAVELRQRDAAHLYAVDLLWLPCRARRRFGPHRLQDLAAHLLVQILEFVLMFFEKLRFVSVLVLAALPLATTGLRALVVKLLLPTVHFDEVPVLIRLNAVLLMFFAAGEEVQDLPAVGVLARLCLRDIPVGDGLDQRPGLHRALADLPA